MIPSSLHVCIALALFLVSCADDSIWWDLPPEMTEDERAAFGEACERWNFVAIRQQYIAEPGDGNRRVFLRLPNHMANGPLANGEYGAGAMHLARGMPRDQATMVIEHEQGHALGLEHHEGPGVMNAHAGQIEFSEGDLAECKRANACR